MDTCRHRLVTSGSGPSLCSYRLYVLGHRTRHQLKEWRFESHPPAQRSGRLQDRRDAAETFSK